MSDEPIIDQPPPQPSDGPDCWRLVIADMEARRLTGIERYGVPLRPNNGRTPLVDAYQEALDLAVYLRQAIEERAAMEAENHRLRCECTKYEAFILERGDLDGAHDLRAIHDVRSALGKTKDAPK